MGQNDRHNEHKNAFWFILYIGRPFLTQLKKRIPIYRMGQNGRHNEQKILQMVRLRLLARLVQDAAETDLGGLASHLGHKL
jgi:hypothetical protein